MFETQTVQHFVVKERTSIVTKMVDNNLYHVFWKGSSNKTGLFTYIFKRKIDESFFSTSSLELIHAAIDVL
jgi:hypothetical protein